MRSSCIRTHLIRGRHVERVQFDDASAHEINSRRRLFVHKLSVAHVIEIDAFEAELDKGERLRESELPQAKERDHLQLCLPLRVGCRRRAPRLQQQFEQAFGKLCGVSVVRRHDL